MKRKLRVNKNVIRSLSGKELDVNGGIVWGNCSVGCSLSCDVGCYAAATFAGEDTCDGAASCACNPHLLTVDCKPVA